MAVVMIMAKLITVASGFEISSKSDSERSFFKKNVLFFFKL